MQSESIVRNREVYGKVCRDVVNTLYGFGVDPKDVLMERVEGMNGNRVRFDVVVRGKEFFGEMTVEEIAVALEGLRMAKALVRLGEFDPADLDQKPPVADVHTQIALSFHDKDFADQIIPNVTASPVRDTGRVEQVAASTAISPERTKNPARVMAGRRNAAKRWGGAQTFGITQATASAMEVPKGRAARQVIAPTPERVTTRGKF